MPKFLVISTSGNPQSKSRRMGQIAFAALQKATVECSWMDLSELDLPVCDAHACYGHAGAQRLTAAVAEADGIIIAAPVYNYDVSASAKNMIELTGHSWDDKIVGFLCAAGGMTSYMSVMAYANSMMLDFRCVIVPRFVYASGNAFADGELTDPKITTRIEQVAVDVVRFTAALRPEVLQRAD